MSDPASTGLPNAIRLAKAKREGRLGRPDQRDAPRPSTFLGPKAVVIPGPLVLGQELAEDEEPVA